MTLQIYNGSHVQCMGDAGFLFDLLDLILQ